VGTSKRSLLTKGLIPLGGAVMAFGLLNPAGAGTKNTGGGYKACGENGSITWTPDTLWPPNHKAQTITVRYADPDAGQKTLALTTNPHNEMVDGEEINGTGNTPSATDSSVGDAASGSGPYVEVEVTAVSERSGHKNADGGRIYEFDYVAENAQSGDTTDGCESDATVRGDGVIVKVPHDCRAGACSAREPATAS
jgi:hypothetical protein